MYLNLTSAELVTIVVAVTVAIVALLAAYVLMRRAASAKLRERFGSEYELAVQKEGSERAAEASLLDREKRVKKLDIRELDPAERTRFLDQWRTVQSHFVESPTGAVTEADELVKSLMQSRGYPVADFEQRAADISVDHPQVVENYRSAHAIATRPDKNGTSTEDLRVAMVHYRSLFEELLHATGEKRAAA